MARVARSAFVLAAFVATGASAKPRPLEGDVTLTLLADQDDSDANGISDAREATATDALWLDGGGKRVTAVKGDALRVVRSQRRWAIRR